MQDLENRHVKFTWDLWESHLHKSWQGVLGKALSAGWGGGVGVLGKVLPAVNLIPQVLTPQAEDQELIEAVNSPQQYLRKTENSITLI